MSAVELGFVVILGILAFIAGYTLATLIWHGW